MNKKILITGASGLVGKKLLPFLQGLGCDCKVLTANKRQKKQEYIFYWNPTEGYIDEDCMEGVSVIIHLAGAGIADKRWTEGYKKLIMDSRVKGADLLFKMARDKHHGITHFISASGSGIYASGINVPADEQAAYGNGFLANVCKRWEEAAFQFEQIGARVSLVRTAVVLAREGGFLKPFDLSMKFRMLPVFGSSKQHLSWIHLDDLVAIYGRLVMDEEFHGVYNASAPEASQQMEFMQMLSRVRKMPCLYPRIPAKLVQLIFGEQAELLLTDRVVYPSKLLRQGFVFKYPTLKEALSQIYAQQ